MEPSLIVFPQGGTASGEAQGGLEWPDSSRLLRAAAECKGRPGPILRALEQAKEGLPVPGEGSTKQLWEFFASIAAVDLVAARTLEPHFDAAAILHQASMPWPEASTWGVFAAEGPGARLEASQAAGQWSLTGTKPWCSLAGQLTHALISAHTEQGRRLFMIELGHPSAEVVDAEWVSRGLSGVPSGPLRCQQTPAQPVGETGWYLERPGFAVGGVGVAACWFGGAVGLFRHLLSSARRREPDQLALAWLGEADRLLASGAGLLGRAAGLADQGELGPREAVQTRGEIARICERLIQLSGHATGPGPLAMDDEHARRVADLSIYIRQHHAARDDAALGRMVLENHSKEYAPW
ncbi:acyl-CoA dehydrogenase [Glutamicibacter protophormiae]|uniref:acyl-CoA dehydrogenase n=1 Tax=Glutamicibacter protophormiae TaxID=37930 RepID=UPI002A7FF723|nr:acyl-CoA dehydrogenase [Glutamicibacter protophormiae]WPR64366.1 acyl-CoA dehydrogenase [Glutamicibacter protophormiae]WPR67859.1 acyl-CoA dehydrogenase [Glutamicibacter protophormiae]